MSIQFNGNPDPLQLCHFSFIPNDVIRECLVPELPIEDRVSLALASHFFSRIAHMCDRANKGVEYTTRFEKWPHDAQKAFLHSVLNGKAITKFSHGLIDELIRSFCIRCMLEGRYDDIIALVKTGKVRALSFCQPMYTCRDKLKGYLSFILTLTELPETTTLTKLSFTCANEFEGQLAQSINHLLSKTSQIAELNLSYVSGVNHAEQYLPDTLSNLTTLQSVSLERCQLTPQLMSKFPTSLLVLKINRSEGLSQQSLDEIPKFLELRDLTLDVNNPSNLTLKFPRYLSSLQIKLRKCTNQASLSEIKDLSNLEHLQLEDIPACSEDDLIALLPLTLRSLKLIGHNFRQGTFHSTISDLLFTKLNQHTKLESIEIEGFFSRLQGYTLSELPTHVKNIRLNRQLLSDTSLRAYMKRHPLQFRRFYFEEMPKINGSFLYGAPPCLQTLSLSDRIPIDHFQNLQSQTNLTDVIIHVVAKHSFSAETLRHLPLSITELSLYNDRVEKVTSLQGLSHLLNLRRLNIFGNINPEGIDTLPPSLRELSISSKSSPDQVEDSSDQIVTMASRLRNLTSLEMLDPSLSGTGLQSLTQIQRLLLPSESKLGDEALIRLKPLQLTELYLNRNTNITGSTLMNLPMSLISLDALNCAIAPEYFSQLSHLLNLKSLKLGRDMTIASSNHLSYFPMSIEFLELNYKLNLSGLSVLERYVNLKHLHLVMNSENGCLNSLSDLPENIEKLRLDLRVYAKPIMPLLDSLKLPRLKRLNLVFGGIITHEFAQAIRRKFPLVKVTFFIHARRMGV